MSKADQLFKKMCQEILDHGIDTQDEIVRPIWQDTKEKAYTIKTFGVINRYDLREEFPALTLRRTALKSAMDEILWIYSKKSNNVNDLNSHIWDAWADENGSIGTCYGNVIGRKDLRKGELIDQMDFVLKELSENPFSRRIITNMYIPQYLDGGALEPCCFMCMYNVTKDHAGHLVLNMSVIQRSQDILAANNWNVCQYAILLMMVARHVHMIPGEMVHYINDAHIYDRHVPMIQELLNREEYDAPIVTLNPQVHNFYEFTVDDLIVKNYKHGDQIKNIPIAL